MKNLNEKYFGCLTFSFEFCSGAALRELFNALDADGSGYITADNLKEIVAQAGYSDQVSDDAIDELIGKCDADGDGRVGFEDFLGALKEHIESQS